MIEKHYVGEINTEVRVDCSIDVGPATVRKIFMKKPDGTILEKIPTVYSSRYLRFFTVAGDFNMSGEYEIQSYVVLNGWAGRGQTATFIVYDQFN